jgi:hypothetical protein
MISLMQAIFDVLLKLVKCRKLLAKQWLYSTMMKNIILYQLQSESELCIRVKKDLFIFSQNFVMHFRLLTLIKSSGLCLFKILLKLIN